MPSPTALASLLAALLCVPSAARAGDEQLVTLENGLVLRGEVREVDGGLELLRDGSWTALPAHVVRGVRELDEVLTEWTERRRPLRRAAPAERVPLVAWQLEVGLYSEALAELDRILEEAPDEPAALALLAGGELPVAVPALEPASMEGVPALLAYAGRSPASLQELVVLRLDQLPLAERRELQPALAADLRHAEANRRRFAALALRRLFPGFSLDELTRRSVVDPAEPVRVQAALALGDSGEESVIDPLARALTSTSATVRTHAAQALGHVGFAAAVEPLALRLSTLSPSGGGGQIAPRGTIFVGRQISYVQDFDPEIATNAVIGDPLIGVVQEGATLDVKVFGASGGAGYTYATETRALRRSLGRLTGATVTDTNTAWRRWWKTHGADWLSAERQALQPGDDELAGSGEGRSGPDHG